jgi:hypothetical protein
MFSQPPRRRSLLDWLRGRWAISPAPPLREPPSASRQLIPISSGGYHRNFLHHAPHPRAARWSRRSPRRSISARSSGTRQIRQSTAAFSQKSRAPRRYPAGGGTDQAGDRGDPLPVCESRQGIGPSAHARIGIGSDESGKVVTSRNVRAVHDGTSASLSESLRPRLLSSRLAGVTRALIRQGCRSVKIPLNLGVGNGHRKPVQGRFESARKDRTGGVGSQAVRAPGSSGSPAVPVAVSAAPATLAP